MPRGDKTSPNGMGAMSGHRMGSCVGNTISNQETNYRGGGGFGSRHRFGRRNYHSARGYGFHSLRELFPSEPVNKKLDVGNQIRNLRDQLEELENQYNNLN